MSRTRPAAPGVLVAGAGPSGLLLAGIVARAGTPVTVLEARPVASGQIRASTLHAGTMQVLHAHGLPGLEELPHTGTGHYVGLPLDLSQAPSPWAGIRRCPQPELLRRLERWARAQGVLLLRGRRVRSVQQDQDQVVVGTADGRRFTAVVLVAADGQASTVREHLRLRCQGPAGTRSMVRADLRDVRLRPRRFERIGARTLTSAALNERITRVMVHDPRWAVGVPVGPEVLRATWRDSTGEQLPQRMDWIDTFCDSTSWVEQMVVGRIAFCGDAAQQFIPIGGAALNGALIGADLLARRILDQLQSRKPTALQEHARASAGVAAREAARLQDEARLLFAVGPEVRRERARIAERIRHDERFRTRLVHQVSRLDPAEPPALESAVSR
jgi:2-polyprenyl-6-methoxyphenol hydroxylase-like FAD-dependent oxidoreductase